MSDELTQLEMDDDAAAAEQASGAAFDPDFASAEDVMADASPTRRVLTMPPQETPPTPAGPLPADTRALDVELAAEADALLDMPLPFESVDEAMAVPTPTPSPARRTEATSRASHLDEANDDAEANESPAEDSVPASTVAAKSEPSKGTTTVTPKPAPAAATPPQPAPVASLSPLVRTLVVINAPLRLVPKRLRPLVDIAALSLLFWAPVVWGLVLFVFNQSD